MEKIISPLRGMKDIYSSDYKKFKKISDIAWNIAENYGYEGLNTPILELVDVFDRSLGGESDIISKEIYNFLDKKGRNIALRPEFTASVMRAIISNKLYQKTSLKLFSSGPLFRYDRPQEGRQRQFHQLNFESIGKKSAILDAEIISCSAQLLEEIGILKDLSLELNSLGCLNSQKNYKEALITYYNRYESELSADSQRRLANNNPLRILDSKSEIDIKISKNAPLIEDFYTDESRAYFDDLKQILDILDIKYKINPRLVRGLDYYCHIIFEYCTTKLGAQSTILAGGRYDGLSEMMGGPEIDAIGFAAGYERIMLMQDIDYLEKKPIYIFPMTKEAEISSLKLAKMLRKENIAVSVDIEGKISKRMQRAAAEKAKYVIFIGEDEIKSGKYTLRNLDSKEELKLTNMQLLSAVSL